MPQFYGAMNTPKKGISIRFTEDEMSMLEALAERYDVPMTQILRWSVKALDDYVETRGGKLTLPLDFSELMKTKEYPQHLNEAETEYRRSKEHQSSTT